MKVRYPLGAAAAAVLALAPLALGHVTANPEAVPPATSSEIAFRVPNERDNAATVRVTINFPKGVYGVTLKRNPGWRTSVKRATLAKPVSFGDRVFRDRIVRATWTGAHIRPGEYDALVVRAFIGAKKGARVSFSAVQVYSNGEVVRWSGPPNADLPAPTVRVTAARPGR